MSNDHFRKRRWVMLGLGLAGLVIALAPGPNLLVAPTDRHFRIEAKSFEYTPPILDVNPGDRVTLDLVSTDVVHGLYVDGYGVNVEADPGQTASLTFVADQPGAFRFRCSVTCGALHPFMIGKLNVGPNGLLARGIALGALAVVAAWTMKVGRG